MQFKAIIFDLDGTIIETNHIWEYINEHMIVSRGHAYTPEIRKDLEFRYSGRSMKECCSILKATFNLTETVEELFHEKKRISLTMYEKDIKFIEGFLPFHKTISDLNLKIALATNALPEAVSIITKTLNLEKYFAQHIYNISHVNYVGKPSPEIYLHAAKQLDVHPKECIAIEDSLSGIESATSAGMYCIGINTGKKIEYLAKAHQIIDKYGDIDLDSCAL